MNDTSNKNSKLNNKPSLNTVSGFLKALVFYAVSFAFWIMLFVTNDGPDGVESQHLVIIGISHAILILIHALSAFKSKEPIKQ